MLLQAGPVLFAGSLQAQTSACDQLKATLASRIASDVRSYSLEALRADVPVPPGAKVIGNCESGAYKIVYRRKGGTLAAPIGASAAGPSPAPPAAAGRDVQTKPKAGDQGVRASPPTAPAAPVDTPRPTVLSTPAASVASAPPQDQETARASSSAASEVVAARDSEPAVARPMQTPRDETPAANQSIAQTASGFIARYWPWMLALALLPVARWAWSWLAYRRVYDKAGLPRGPKF